MNVDDLSDIYTVEDIIKWLVSDDTGVSSKTLLVHMLGIEVEKINGFRKDRPYDASDRGRCIRLLKKFPQWLERLDEMEVYEGWKDQIVLIKREFNLQ